MTLPEVAGAIATVAVVAFVFVALIVAVYRQFDGALGDGGSGRSRWYRRRIGPRSPRGGSGSGSSGSREPRRPQPHAGSGTEAVPLPDTKAG